MPKIIKPEHILSEEDKKGINEGITTISQVSKDKNIPYGSVYSQVKKGKLAVTFEKGLSDNTSARTMPDFKEAEPSKIIDYTASVSNFWSFVDMIFRFICPLFRLVYTGMDKDTIVDLTEKTKEKLGQFITGHTYVDWLGTVGVIGYTFVTRIKVKPKESNKEENKKPIDKHIDNSASADSSSVTTPHQKVVNVESSSQALEPTKEPKDYKLTQDGLVKSDLSVEEIKKKLGMQ